jgi:hypothetical protein
LAQCATEDDVFRDEPKTRVILVGASHLSHLQEYLDDSRWAKDDLTKPGWKVSGSAVAVMARDIEDALIDRNVEETILLVQYWTTASSMSKEWGEKSASPPKLLTSHTM